MRTEGAVFSRAEPGSVSPLFRNSSWVYTRLDGSGRVSVVVVVSVAQPEKIRVPPARRPRAQWGSVISFDSWPPTPSVGCFKKSGRRFESRHGQSHSPIRFLVE